MGKQFLGIKALHVASCPCCGAVDADVCHVRICPRSGSKVKQHQPLIHSLSRTLKQLHKEYGVEDDDPYTFERGYWMDTTIIPAGQLREDQDSDVTYVVCRTPSMGHLQSGSDIIGGLGAAAPEAR